MNEDKIIEFVNDLLQEKQYTRESFMTEEEESELRSLLKTFVFDKNERD